MELPKHKNAVRAAVGICAPVLLVAGPLTVSACAAHYERVPVEPPSFPDGVVFLIGDGGEVGSVRDRLLGHVGVQVEALRSEDGDLPVAVVYLGDNVYEEGVRPDHVAEDAGKLAAQVSVGATPDRPPVYFLPGNHDWADGGTEAEGVRRLRLQAAVIDSLAGDRASARLAPVPGCPGPETASLGEVATLVFIDTEWLLRDADTCEGWDRARFLNALRDSLGAFPETPKIVLAHHPLVTGGPHGGAWAGTGFWGNLIAPFRWLGYRLGIRGQDVTSGRYARMVDDLLEVFFEEGRTPIAYAAGHDHSLQVIGVERDGTSLLALVSGSVSRPTNVGKAEGVRFATSRQGYMRLDLLGDSARVTVFSFDDSGASAVDGSSASGIRADFSCRVDDCPEAARDP